MRNDFKCSAEMDENASPELFLFFGGGRNQTEAVR